MNSNDGTSKDDVEDNKLYEKSFDDENSSIDDKNIPNIY